MNNFFIFILLLMMLIHTNHGGLEEKNFTTISFLSTEPQINPTTVSLSSASTLKAALQNEKPAYFPDNFLSLILNTVNTFFSLFRTTKEEKPIVTELIESERINPNILPRISRSINTASPYKYKPPLASSEENGDINFSNFPELLLSNESYVPSSETFSSNENVNADHINDKPTSRLTVVKRRKRKFKRSISYEDFENYSMDKNNHEEYEDLKDSKKEEHIHPRHIISMENDLENLHTGSSEVNLGDLLLENSESVLPTMERDPIRDSFEIPDPLANVKPKNFITEMGDKINKRDVNKVSRDEKKNCNKKKIPQVPSYEPNYFKLLMERLKSSLKKVHVISHGSNPEGYLNKPSTTKETNNSKDFNPNLNVLVKKFFDGKVMKVIRPFLVYNSEKNYHHLPINFPNRKSLPPFKEFGSVDYPNLLVNKENEIPRSPVYNSDDSEMNETRDHSNPVYNSDNREKNETIDQSNAVYSFGESNSESPDNENGSNTKLDDLKVSDYNPDTTDIEETLPDKKNESNKTYQSPQMSYIIKSSYAYDVYPKVSAEEPPEENLTYPIYTPEYSVLKYDDPKMLEYEKSRDQPKIQQISEGSGSDSTMEEPDSDYILEKPTSSSARDGSRRAFSLEERGRGPILEESRRAFSLEEPGRGSVLEESRRASNLEEPGKGSVLEKSGKALSLEEPGRGSVLKEPVVLEDYFNEHGIKEKNAADVQPLVYEFRRNFEEDNNKMKTTLHTEIKPLDYEKKYDRNPLEYESNQNHPRSKNDTNSSSKKPRNLRRKEFKTIQKPYYFGDHSYLLSLVQKMMEGDSKAYDFNRPEPDYKRVKNQLPKTGLQLYYVVTSFGSSGNYLNSKIMPRIVPKSIDFDQSDPKKLNEMKKRDQFGEKHNPPDRQTYLKVLINKLIEKSMKADQQPLEYLRILKGYFERGYKTNQTGDESKIEDYQIPYKMNRLENHLKVSSKGFDYNYDNPELYSTKSLEDEAKKDYLKTPSDRKTYLKPVIMAKNLLKAHPQVFDYNYDNNKLMTGNELKADRQFFGYNNNNPEEYDNKNLGDERRKEDERNEDLRKEMTQIPEGRNIYQKSLINKLMTGNELKADRQFFGYNNNNPEHYNNKNLGDERRKDERNDEVPKEMTQIPEGRTIYQKSLINKLMTGNELKADRQFFGYNNNNPEQYDDKNLGDERRKEDEQKEDVPKEMTRIPEGCNKNQKSLSNKLMTGNVLKGDSSFSTHNSYRNYDRKDLRMKKENVKERKRILSVLEYLESLINELITDDIMEESKSFDFDSREEYEVDLREGREKEDQKGGIEDQREKFGIPTGREYLELLTNKLVNSNIMKTMPIVFVKDYSKNHRTSRYNGRSVDLPRDKGVSLVYNRNRPNQIGPIIIAHYIKTNRVPDGIRRCNHLNEDVKEKSPKLVDYLKLAQDMKESSRSPRLYSSLERQFQRRNSLTAFADIMENKGLPKSVRGPRSIDRKFLVEDDLKNGTHPNLNGSLHDLEESKSEPDPISNTITKELSSIENLSNNTLITNLENSLTEQHDYKLEKIVKKDSLWRIMNTLRDNLRNLNFQEQKHYLSDLKDVIKYNDVTRPKISPPMYYLENSDTEHVSTLNQVQKLITQTIPFYISDNSSYTDDFDNYLKILLKRFVRPVIQPKTPDYNLENSNTEQKLRNTKKKAGKPYKNFPHYHQYNFFENKNKRKNKIGFNNNHIELKALEIRQKPKMNSYDLEHRKLKKNIKKFIDYVQKKIKKQIGFQKQIPKRLPLKVIKNPKTNNKQMESTTRIVTTTELDHNFDLDKIEQSFLSTNNYRENLTKAVPRPSLLSYHLMTQSADLKDYYNLGEKPRTKMDSVRTSNATTHINFWKDRKVNQTEVTDEAKNKHAITLALRMKPKKKDDINNLAEIIKEPDLINAIQILSDVIFEKLLNKTRSFIHETNNVKGSTQRKHHQVLEDSRRKVINLKRTDFYRVRRDSKLRKSSYQHRIRSTKQAAILTSFWSVIRSLMNPKKPKRTKRTPIDILEVLNNKLTHKIRINNIMYQNLLFRIKEKIEEHNGLHRNLSYITRNGFRSTENRNIRKYYVTFVSRNQKILQNLKRLLNSSIYYLKTNKRLKAFKKMFDIINHQQKNMITEKLNRLYNVLYKFYNIIVYNKIMNRLNISNGTHLGYKKREEPKRPFKTNAWERLNFWKEFGGQPKNIWRKSNRNKIYPRETKRVWSESGLKYIPVKMENSPEAGKTWDEPIEDYRTGKNFEKKSKGDYKTRSVWETFGNVLETHNENILKILNRRRSENSKKTLKRMYGMDFPQKSRTISGHDQNDEINRIDLLGTDQNEIRFEPKLLRKHNNCKKLDNEVDQRNGPQESRLSNKFGAKFYNNPEVKDVVIPYLQTWRRTGNVANPNIQFKTRDDTGNIESPNILRKSKTWDEPGYNPNVLRESKKWKETGHNPNILRESKIWKETGHDPNILRESKIWDESGKLVLKNLKRRSEIAKDDRLKTIMNLRPRIEVINKYKPRITRRRINKMGNDYTKNSKDLRTSIGLNPWKIENGIDKSYYIQIFKRKDRIDPNVDTTIWFGSKRNGMDQNYDVDRLEVNKNKCNQHFRLRQQLDKNVDQKNQPEFRRELDRNGNDVSDPKNGQKLKNGLKEIYKVVQGLKKNSMAQRNSDFTQTWNGLRGTEPKFWQKQTLEDLGNIQEKPGIDQDDAAKNWPEIKIKNTKGYNIPIRKEVKKKGMNRNNDSEFERELEKSGVDRNIRQDMERTKNTENYDPEISQGLNKNEMNRNYEPGFWKKLERNGIDRKYKRKNWDEFINNKNIRRYNPEVWQELRKDGPEFHKIGIARKNNGKNWQERRMKSIQSLNPDIWQGLNKNPELKSIGLGRKNKRENWEMKTKSIGGFNPENWQELKEEIIRQLYKIRNWLALKKDGAFQSYQPEHQENSYEPDIGQKKYEPKSWQEINSPKLEKKSYEPEIRKNNDESEIRRDNDELVIQGDHDEPDIQRDNDEPEILGDNNEAEVQTHNDKPEIRRENDEPKDNDESVIAKANYKPKFWPTNPKFESYESKFSDERPKEPKDNRMYKIHLLKNNNGGNYYLNNWQGLRRITGYEPKNWLELKSNEPNDRSRKGQKLNILLVDNGRVSKFGENTRIVGNRLESKRKNLNRQKLDENYGSKSWLEPKDEKSFMAETPEDLKKWMTTFLYKIKKICNCKIHPKLSEHEKLNLWKKLNIDFNFDPLPKRKTKSFFDPHHKNKRMKPSKKVDHTKPYKNLFESLTKNDLNLLLMNIKRKRKRNNPILDLSKPKHNQHNFDFRNIYSVTPLLGGKLIKFHRIEKRSHDAKKDKVCAGSQKINYISKNNEIGLRSESFEKGEATDTTVLNLTTIVVRYSDNPYTLLKNNTISFPEFIDEVISLLQGMKEVNQQKNNEEIERNPDLPFHNLNQIPISKNLKNQTKDDGHDLCNLFRDLLIYLRLKLQQNIDGYKKVKSAKYLEEPIPFPEEESVELRSIKSLSALLNKYITSDANNPKLSNLTAKYKKSINGIKRLIYPEDINRSFKMYRVDNDDDDQGDIDDESNYKGDNNGDIYEEDNDEQSIKSIKTSRLISSFKKLKKTLGDVNNKKEPCEFKTNPIFYNYTKPKSNRVDYLEERKLRMIHGNNRIAVLYHKELLWPDKISKMYAKKHSELYNSDVIYINATTSVSAVSNLYDLEDRERIFECYGQAMDHLNFLDQLFQIFNKRNALFVFINANPHDNILNDISRVMDKANNIKLIITSTSSQWNPYTFSVINIPRNTNGQWLTVKDQERQFKNSYYKI